MINEWTHGKTVIEIEMTGEETFNVQFPTEISPYTPEGGSYVERLINTEKNTKELSRFFEFCEKHFPEDFDNLHETFLSQGNNVTPVHFNSFFESLMIQNNFALTFREEPGRNHLMNTLVNYFHKSGRY